MTARTLLAGALISAASPMLYSQSLEKAEVTIPYTELKALLAKGATPEKLDLPSPVLVSARLKLTMDRQRPVIDATFRVAGFGGPLEMVSLIAGDISLDTQEPENAVVMVKDGILNLAVDQAGTRTFRAKLLPVLTDGGFSLSLPPCPSPLLETGAINATQSIFVEYNGERSQLTAEQTLPLSATGSTLTFKFLTEEELLEAQRPPEPSAWSWQHQALVTPSEDCLIYQIVSRATAEGGSGMAADLALPPDARDVDISGDDLLSNKIISGENRTRHLALTWKSRDILDRKVVIRYRTPLRPLDRKWVLQAPGDAAVTTRFIVVTSPMLSMEADGLSAPVSPKGLPKDLIDTIGENPVRYLESHHTAEVQVASVPVAVTAEGVIPSAKWILGIEPDGAMLAVGEMTVDHKGPLDLLFDTPEGMKLLRCELDEKPISPVDLGSGGLKVSLPSGKVTAVLRCSFTGNAGALDPVEGTFKLALPKTPLFIHALEWQIDLPNGYQAEIQGNIKRGPVTKSPAPWRIGLRKNLCRDERPEVHVFYQRANLNP